MTINVWGRETPNPIAIVNDGGDQNNPAVADLGGAEFAVAWIDGATVTLKFFDEQGNVNPALQQALMTDGIGTDIKDLHLAGGGAGMGYGAAWSETNGGVTQLKLRYFDGVAGAVRGDEIAISNNSAVNQHDMDLSAYGKDDARGRPIVDGFDAVWVEGNGGAHALGAIYVQRFGVPLDARRDPSGPPAASGIDGIRGSGSDAQLLIAASGRDPSIVGLHEHVGGANETIITWIDASNNINIRAYNDAGTQLNTLGVTVTNLNTAGRPLAVGAQQHVTAIQGGGFVVAWVSTNGSGDNVLAARVFTPGAAAGTWAASGVIVLDQLNGASNNIADFSLATLETGGFAVSWNATDNGAQAIFSRTYSSGGVAAENAATIFHAPADATHVAISGIVGDRYVAVYQDNSTSGDPSNIMARILDPRLDGAGDPIVLNGEGLLLIGDPDFATRGRTAPDVLVGTIGKDQIDGRLANDILDGGLGDDVIAAGGGDDTIDGGGGNDTLILTGRFTLDGDSTNDDYTINHLGGGLFQIIDKRANADGSDLVRSMETFEFVGSATSYTFEQLLGVEVTNITPTAWGWTDEDADAAPNAHAIPDVDGFLVNAATRAGIQSHASVADSVGEFVAVAWEDAATVGADTHIRGQFFDVILAPDSFIPNTLNISDGIGIETNPVVSSGGANSGWGFAWEQRDNASDTTRELRTNFVGPGQLTGPELSVLVEANVDQHDAAIFGSFLDRTLASPVGGSVLPTGMSDGYNVVWVSTHTDGIDGAQPAGYGRIMLQRFEVPLDALGNPGAAVAGGIDGIANLNNAYGTMDAAVWVGDEDANGSGGMFGRNPSTSALHTFESGIVWIAQDGAGHEKVMFRAYDDLGNVISYAAGNNISAGYAVAAGTNAHIVSAGAVNFAIVWITPDASSPSGYTVMGTMLSSAGNGLNGVGFGFGAPPEPFVVAQLPAGFDPVTGNFQATGLSGEDSNDLAISWSMDNGATGVDMMAQHVRVTLDPVTGIALNMVAEGDVIRVNAAAEGDQTDGVIAGLLGDRFVAIYTDNNGVYTDGSDLVGRVIDTRDAVNPEPIVGDLVQPGGRIQARRDVIVGTNGNDDILADIQNNDGLVDWVYAGMGDDTIQGGPGIKGAAGIPEIIDGGEGNDTAVYTGRLQDYSITVNGDGSLEVIDLRPVQDAQGNPAIHDGIDNLYSIENLKFLDLSNNGASAQTIALGFPGAPPALNPNYDGTPVAWSLTDTTAFKEITVDTDPTPADAADRPAGIVVTNLQDGAGLAWTRNGNQVWAITYDTTGTADPVLLGQNTQLTSGAFATNTVRDIDVAMTAGLGMTAVWESAVAFAQPVIDAAAAARDAALTAWNNAIGVSNAADAASATAQALADTTDAAALQSVANAAAQQAALTDAADLQLQLTAAIAADNALVTAQQAYDAAVLAAGASDAADLQTQLTAAIAADDALTAAQQAYDAAALAAGASDAADLQTQLTAAIAADDALTAAQQAYDAAVLAAGASDAADLQTQLTAAIAADDALTAAQEAYNTAVATQTAVNGDPDATQEQIDAADAAVVTTLDALNLATTEAGQADVASLQTQLTAALAADAAAATAQSALNTAIAADVAAAAAQAAAVSAAQAETTALNGYYNALAAYQTAVEGDSALHLAFASTNTHLVLDPAGGVPGPGIPGGEIVVVGTDGAGEAVDPVVQGYEIVDVNNDTLEVGFHIGFELKDDGILDTVSGDQYGALMLARYEIPVYDILVDNAGLPILDGNGQGQLATDAFGNLVPSTAATFGVGSETAPISLGLDGVRGTADDNQAIVLTDQGLFAANNIPGGAHVIQGRNMTIGSLHDGQLVVSYIGTDEKVHLSIFLPTINETADRETRGVGTNVVATGLTTYSQFAIPFPTTFGTVAPGQAAMTVAQQNGSFGVFWAEPDGAGTIKVMGIIYSGAGSNWSPSPVITFKAGLPANTAFEVASSGVTPGGLEDGFFVSWESAGQGIHGQRFDMTGATVGQQIVVGDPTSGTPGTHSSTGIDDGRMLVGYVDGTGVSAQFLDNREPGIPLIGPRTGAPRDVIVGTVGDDAIDGRALEDQLYGGLGNDFITMGADADIGFGGEGNDTVIGGGGQDQLYGEAGDDLLWGGLSGPAAPFDRDVNTGLVAAGVNAALIATNPGVDVISGGAGNDTISFQGEFGAFNINLATGIVTSDRDLNGSFILEDIIGAMVDDGAGGQIFQFSFDVENATGGIGNDTITGDAGANILLGLGGDDVLTGGGGNDILDGGAGTDRAVFAGVVTNYAFSLSSGALIVRDLVGTGGTDTLRNIERFRFSNGVGGTVEFTLTQLQQLQLPATGVPVISDTTPLQGQTLSVNTSAIADFNGLGTFSFQWQRSANGTTWANIAGATASSYTLPDAPGTDLGQFLANQLRVVVSFTDGLGHAESVTSAATSPIGLNYSAAASATGVSISGRAGDDYIVGSNFVDRLQGMAGNDTLIGGGGADEFFGGDGNDVMLGSLAANDGNDVFNGGAGDDVMFGGAGDDTLGGGDGFDRADFTGPVGNYLFSTGGLDNALVTDAVGNEGKDSVRNVEVLRFAGVDYSIVMDASGGANSAVNGPAGQAGSQIVFGLGGADTLFGGDGSDILVSGFGNDTVFGGAGDDFIYQRTDETGRDIVDGGDGTDTYILAGNADVETFRIYTRVEALAAGITNIAANTEIVITRNGTNNASIIAQLDNVEEIKINMHSIANTGNVGDSVIVIGDFNQTSLHFNTIRVDGTNGSDTIDITGLTSAHRVVFESNGGGDTIVGQVRSQDIFNGVGLNDQRVTDTASLLPDFGMSDGVGSLVSGRGETAMLVDFTPSRSLFSPAALSADAVIAILQPGADMAADHTTIAPTAFEFAHLPALPLPDFHGQLSLDSELQHLFAARDGLVS